MDPQKLAEVLDKYVKKSLASCPQGLPAQIVYVHPQGDIADIKIPWSLLLPDLSSVQVPLIPNVRMIHAIHKSVRVAPVYERGDFVWVSFSSFDIQMNEDQRELSLSLSLHNAVILGHFAPYPTKSLLDGVNVSSTDLLRIHTWKLQAHPSAGVILDAPCRLGSAPQSALLSAPVLTAMKIFVQQISLLPPITPADGGSAFKTALALSVQNLCESMELAASKEVFFT